MPVGPKRLPFFEHLAELRHRIIVVGVAVLVGAMVMYYFTDPILDVLLEPIKAYLPNGKLTVFGPFEAFTFRFKVALYASIVVTSPIILYQFFAFFLPALKPNEQKWILPTVASALVLFLSGNLFCYEVVLGPAIQWSVAQGGDFVQSLPSADRFLNGITLMMLGFGVAFQLPVVVFYLVGFGVIPYAKMRANWRYVYVTLMIVAAMATPDWNPLTMAALYGALIGLYEGSLALVRVVFGRRIREQALAEG